MRSRERKCASMRERRERQAEKRRVSERDEGKRTTIDAREGTQRRVEAIDYQLNTRNRTRNNYDFRSISRSFLVPSRVQFRRNMEIEIIDTSRERKRGESARGMSESTTERERKAGGKNMYVYAVKGAQKGGRERRVKEIRTKGRE